MSNITAPVITFTGMKERGSIPKWVNNEELECSRADNLTNALASSKGTDIIVIQEPTAGAFLKNEVQIRDCIFNSKEVIYNVNFVLTVARPPRNKRKTINDLIYLFPEKLSQNVEISLGSDSLESSLWEAYAKHSRRFPNPLGQSSVMSELAPHLRSDSGRISAKKISQEFGVTLTFLASHLGVSKQALSKTPDAKSIQKSLKAYDVIYQLRSTLDQDAFRNWLNYSFSDLDDLTPVELISQGEIDVVADFAEQALLGTPS